MAVAEQGVACVSVPPLLQARRRGRGRPRCHAPARAPPPPAASTPPSTSRPSGTGSGRRRGGWTRCGAQRACSRPAARAAAAWPARGRPPCPAHVSRGLRLILGCSLPNGLFQARIRAALGQAYGATLCAVVTADALFHAHKPCLVAPVPTGHSTPQRSRVPSRDPAADRAQRAAECSRAAPGSDPRERKAAVRSTERLRAAVSTTPKAAGLRAVPPREQRATSPGRALLEVRERLQQYTQKPPGSSGRGGPGGAPLGGSMGHSAQVLPVGGAAAGAGQRQRVPATGDHYADASAEIADIDSRLQSLQNFLRSAKAGQAVAVPT